MDPFALIAAEPPSFLSGEVLEALDRQFGLRGELRPLVSERDQNFRLQTPDRGQFLVKVASAYEARGTTEFQVAVLRYLEKYPEVLAPRVVNAAAGAAFGHLACRTMTHRLRVLSWVDGEQLETIGIRPELAERFGRALGKLDHALAGFSYSGDNPVLLWDLQRVCELRPLLAYIEDVPVRRRVAAAIDDFADRVLPAVPTLGKQVIHSDANPENILLADGRIGFIDFSDIVMAPRVFELAIAASYLRDYGEKPLTLIGPLVSGYHAIAELRGAEAGVLFDLVRARLATSITLLFWRLRGRPEDDEYRRKSLELESGASHFLAALDVLGRERFSLEINALIRA